MTQPGESSGLGMVPDERFDASFSDSGAMEESEFTQTQMEFTQLTQPGLTPDESSNLLSASSCNHTPLSPPPIIPYGRLVPCVPSVELTAVDLMPTQDSYWLGRSQKCDITAQYSSDKTKELTEKEKMAFEWGKSMISNRHCRIFQQNNGSQLFIEDNSGNGTFINQQTHLRKGETRILHSGDEVCLINVETLRKKITSYRIIQMVAQQFSFIIVQSKPRKPCVNPRAMNYNPGKLLNDNSISDATKKSPPPSPGRRIEEFYDLREILGDGTSGQVRRAIHRQSGKERAVKIISLRRYTDTSIMEREVSLLQSLDHPYIVKLVEVFTKPGVAMYLVMELVKGGDLFDCIVEKQRYTEVEARRAMRRLLSAVYYLHEKSNVVHRDLKPENILCSSPTDVKLADFGLAKIVKADGLKTFCGTPAYFAPEVLQRRGTVAGQGRYGKPADMWSLGVILYILLTGKPPFDADMDESSKGFEVDFESDAHIWSKISDAKDLVQQMLRQDPKRRLTVRQACVHSWINVEDGDTHCSPLDDPVVATKKCPDTMELTVRNLDDRVTNSTCSDNLDTSEQKESTSSASTHELNDSIFRSRDKALSESETTDVAIPPSNLKTNMLENHSAPDSEKPCRETAEECNDKRKEGSDDGEIQRNLGGSPKTKNERPNVGSSSEDECVLPRSPLTKLSLNQRSNKFRDQIIKQSQEPFDSPNGSTEHQAAVTPTSSNIKRQLEKVDSDAENGEGDIEDPILSQFSSELSSVESFSDCSIAENTKVEEPQKDPDPKKRPAGEDSMKRTENPSKRAKVCGPKQTTLSAWLLKKSK